MSQTYNLELTLDVNTEIYPLKVFDRFSLALTTRLRKDDEPDDGTWDQSGILPSFLPSTPSRLNLTEQKLCVPSVLSVQRQTVRSETRKLCV